MLGVANALLRTVGTTLPPLSAQLIGRWALDEASGPTATDAAGHSHGTYTNVALGQDPLVEGDPGTSVRFFGDSAVRIPHVGAYEVESYSVVVYGQVQSGPGPGANAMLAQKDRPGLPGGWQLAIVDDSGTLRLQAYTKNEAAEGQYIGSSSGVGQVQAGAAFMLVMTCGGSGTRLYLDKAELGSTTNGVGLLDNDEQIGIGRYRPGISNTAGFKGWLDEVRFYRGVLTQAEIEALPSAQDLVVREVGTFTIPAIPAAPTGTTIRYVSTSGSNVTGTGTIGSPWRTVAHAIANTPNSTGTTIVLRKGIYRGEVSLSPGSRRITGYRTDIEANPLLSANWPILDGGIDMSGVTWELVDAGRQEYRTQQSYTALGLNGPDTKVWAFAYAGTDPYEIPRWEPLGGWIEPQRGIRLMPYRGHNNVDDWSLNCFRHTGTVASENVVTYYYGPGIMVLNDRLHIRLQPVDNSVDGGYTADEFHGDYNPANHSIFLAPFERILFTPGGIGTGFICEGVFIRGYDDHFRGMNANNVTFRRNVIWGGDYNNTSCSIEGTASNFLFQHNVYVAGLQDSHQWGTGKHSPWQDAWGANMGRIVLFSQEANTSVRVLDNLMLRCFDVVVGSGTGHEIEVGYNAIEVIDDVTQLGGSQTEHVHHNYVVGPLFGAGGQTVPGDNRHDINHNVCVLTRWRPWRATLMWSWTVYTPHSPLHGRNFTIAHNTIIYTNPRRESSVNVSSMSPGTSLRNPTSPEFQDLFNNIFIVVNRDPPGKNTTPHRHFIGNYDVNNAGARGRMDGNAYHKVDLDGLSGGPLLGSVQHSGGNSTDFTTLAAFKASAHFTASKFHYAPGWENTGIQANPQFVGGSDAFVNEGRGVPPSYYIPQNTAYHTAAINLGSGGLNLGLPGYTYQAWRGALDPEGDGTEVGPRAA
jgi:Concanavalin A-like lectin/glucanases superfamily